MATLAIKGHPTRGKEVIEILEMLGGINKHDYIASCESLYFYISEKTKFIYFDWCFGIDEHTKLFTLEEFLEKFPYKVGDKVRLPDYESEVKIEGMEWDGYGIVYEVYTDNYEWFSVDELNAYNEPYIEQETVDKTKFPYEIGTRVSVKSPYIKKLATIVGLSYNSCACMQYEIKFDGEDVVVHYPTDLMIPVTMEEQIKMDIPKGYKFVCVDNGNQQVVLEKIKLQYPKNYEECIGKLSINWDGEVKGHKSDLLYNFQKLLIARDVYWKIAGKELGLDKPWEPDWNDCTQHKFGLYTFENEIRCINLQVLKNIILVFPTAEMRDVFYENFKSLIEQCKELL